MDAQKRIRQLMKEHGWTEYRLAKEASLSPTTISNMFRRNNAPSLPTLEALCTAFGISLSQFFAEGNDMMELTDDQRELFECWLTLTKEQKAAIKALIKTMN